MKNVGKCHANQIAPRMSAAAIGDRRESSRGSANPRHPNSSPSGPVSLTSVSGARYMKRPHVGSEESDVGANSHVAPTHAAGNPTTTAMYHGSAAQRGTSRRTDRKS